VGGRESSREKTGDEKRKRHSWEGVHGDVKK